MNKRRAEAGGLRLAGALTFGLMMVAAAGSARSDEVYTFDIPRGDLAMVLTRIALEGRSQIVFPADLARGREVGPIRSRETVEAALAHALVGTDLEIGRGASGILMVRRTAVSTADIEDHEAMLLQHHPADPEPVALAPVSVAGAAAEREADAQP